MIVIAILAASVAGWEAKPLPSVDTEFRGRIESAFSDARSLQAGGGSRSEVEQYVQRIVMDLLDTHGKAGFIEQCVALRIEQGEMDADTRTVMFTSQLTPVLNRVLET